MARAISITAEVPLALSSAPGARSRSEEYESKCPPTTISGPCTDPGIVPTTFICGYFPCVKLSSSTDRSPAAIILSRIHAATDRWLAFEK